METATDIKRRDLEIFIERVLKPEAAVQAVIGIGSIASGQARPDSDIDAIVFLEPFDWYIIPAEFVWRPSDGTFHSIFAPEAEIGHEGIALDLLRLDLRLWSSPNFYWPEGRRAELVNGWIAFDRSERVTELIAKRTAYPEPLRVERLDDSITWLDQHLGEDGPQIRWQSLPPLVAHDRLQAAYSHLVRGLFAYNRRWLPFRDREMEALLGLPWLPDNFTERLAAAAHTPSWDYEGYLARAEAIRSLANDLTARLTADGDYSNVPTEQAFIRSHDEPGYAWNMDEWNRERLRRALQQ
jgi:hypothetical protein